MSKGASFIPSIFEKEAELWKAASETHPFLVGCADGTVSKTQFDTWMVQDFLYVSSFQPFMSGVVTIAPEEDKEVLKSGLNAVNNELDWFQVSAKDRGLELSALPLPTTSKYKEFMLVLAEENYSLQVIALYLIERVYQSAWNIVLEKAGKDGIYSIYAQNWGNADYKAYVDLLGQIADREMQTNNVKEDEIYELFVKIMKIEILFWDMAFESVSSN